MKKRDEELEAEIKTLKEKLQSFEDVDPLYRIFSTESLMSIHA